MMYEQGEIVLIPFPYSDLTGAKQRPALIVSNRLINKSEDRICCLVTSNMSKDGVLVEEKYFSDSRLPFKSWVKPHRLFTVHEKIIKKRICIITEDFHNKIVGKISECVELKK